MNLKARTPVIFVLLGALTALLFVLDLTVGAVSIPLHQVWAALTAGDCPAPVAKTADGRDSGTHHRQLIFSVTFR